MCEHIECVCTFVFKCECVEGLVLTIWGKRDARSLVNT